MAVPHSRTPRCMRHHVWHVNCPDCGEQRKYERAAALARIERARLEAGRL